MPSLHFPQWAHLLEEIVSTFIQNLSKYLYQRSLFRTKIYYGLYLIVGGIADKRLYNNMSITTSWEKCTNSIYQEYIYKHMRFMFLNIANWKTNFMNSISSIGCIKTAIFCINKASLKTMVKLVAVYCVVRSTSLIGYVNLLPFSKYEKQFNKRSLRYSIEYFANFEILNYNDRQTLNLNRIRTSRSLTEE